MSGTTESHEPWQSAKLLHILNSVPETDEEKAKRQQRLIQQAVLRNYPNPERKGCPGTPVIRDLAVRSARLEIVENDDWEHIIHCSPCYAEYLAITNEVRGAAGNEPAKGSDSAPRSKHRQ